MKKLLICGALILLGISATFSQKRGSTKAAKAKPIVFAVIDDGQTLEPIGEINKGELVGAASDQEEKALQNFANAYYKPKSTYNLIFGGAANGTVTVVSSDPKSDCGKNLAQITTQSSKAKLKGLVMGLATNQNPAKTASGVRRLPTAVERAEIETLVRAEFVKQGVSAKAVKNMKYYNLTALDADRDGKAEMVGSFWTENSSKERNLLFFIAEKNKNGKYNFNYSEYEKITPEKIMSGELKDLDELGGELLLDALEYNGDKTAEIFTINKAFEGNNFHVYSRKNGKWTRIFEGYNYHCAY
ncbi:MAG: hypothetical protein LC768_13725 [Acidobacteria bacterium]|nr:hypothetical protein [Acidobacteriota bacterium]MCA1639370.1 hypothetical protein [Acidobacteriota bacterium]